MSPVIFIPKRILYKTWEFRQAERRLCHFDQMEVLGAAGSIVSIIDVAARCIGSLRALQQRWKDADLTVVLLISQVATLKAALGKISEWIVSTARKSPLDDQLKTDLELSLNCCGRLLAFIDEHLASLVTDEYNDFVLQSRARIMMQDGRVRECISHLNNQAAALNLLLTAMNC